RRKSPCALTLGKPQIGAYALDGQLSTDGSSRMRNRSWFNLLAVIDPDFCASVGAVHIERNGMRSLATHDPPGQTKPRWAISRDRALRGSAQPQQLAYGGKITATDFGAAAGTVEAGEHATVGQSLDAEQARRRHQAVAVQADQLVGVGFFQLAQRFLDQQFTVAVMHDD